MTAYVSYLTVLQLGYTLAPTLAKMYVGAWALVGTDALLDRVQRSLDERRARDN